METINKQDKNTNDNHEKESIYHKAEKSFNNGELEEALLLFDMIDADDPNYGKALFLKSMILGSQSDEEKSNEMLEKTTTSQNGEDMVDFDEKLKPLDINNPQDLFNAGLTNFYFGDYEKAIENFNLSLQKLPNQSEVIYYKSLSYACIEEYKKAIKTINHAIELQPSNSRYWNDKGAFYSELNKVAKAHQCFNRSIRLKPDSMNWSNKAVLYHKCNNLEKALECYDKAIELDSEDIYPVVGKAKVYMEMEDFKKAEKYFELAEKIDNNDLEYLVERGKYMIFTKKYRQAVKYFNKCLKYNENLAYVWMFKSMALKKMNHYYEAEMCIDKAVELDEDILRKFNEIF